MIVILHSAISSSARLDDQETLIQVTAVKDALEQLGYKVVTIPLCLNFKELKKTLDHYNPELIFNLVESINGRSDLCHLVPLWLEKLKRPFTGGSAQSILLSADKLLAKHIFAQAEIANPSYITPQNLLEGNFPDDGPYIIKSAREDGSLGIDQSSIVNNHTDFMTVINDRQRRFGGEWFGERYIPGRELNISLLAGTNGPEILPIAEIEFKQMTENQYAIVDYAAKWQLDSQEYVNTPRVFNQYAAEVSQQLKRLAIACWETFSVNGYARVDIRMDKLGQPWVLELNINPSLAPDAGFVAAAAVSGLEYTNLIDRIIKDAWTCYD